MGPNRKVTSDSSENEEDIESDNSNPQKNGLLLQSSNLTSTKSLLSKSSVLNNKFQHILNKTTHQKSSDVANGKGKMKLKKKKQEQVSSSCESSEEERKIQISFNIKEKKVKKPVSSSEDNKSQDKSIIRKRDASTSEDSEPDSSNSEVDESNFLPRPLQNIKKTDLSASEHNLSLNNETDDTEISVVSSSEKIKSSQHSHKKRKRKSSSSNRDEFNVKNKLYITNKKVHINADGNKDEEKTDEENLDECEKMMENIERKIGKKSHSKGVLDTPSKSKVNVLQNICLLPPKAKSLNIRLEEFYPGMKQLKKSTRLDFLDSEEIYLFRIPKNVDPNSLKNIEIRLDEKCKINIGDKYNIEPTPKIPDPSLVISDNCKIIDFKGNIKMEKYVKSKKEPKVDVPEKKLMALPDNLKKRHPLFGSDYKQKIKLSEQVEKKLDQAIENLLKKEERIKKKKHKKAKVKEEEESEKETIFTLLDNHNLLSSITRVKNEVSDDSAFCSSSSTEKTNKLHKNDKHDVMNETLKRIKSEIVSDNESSNLENTSRKKRKKEKKSKSGEQEIAEKQSIKEDVETNPEEPISTSSHHKNNQLSIINSTLRADILRTPSFNPEVSEIKSEDLTLEKMSKSKKKKKSKEDRDLIEKEIISDIYNEINLNPKKIKKKKT